MDCEELWVERAQQGDRNAYDRLVAKHHRRILNHCTRIMHNAPEAEEAAQDVFLKAWEKLDRFRFACPFIKWLMIIATNTCLNLVRKKRGEPTTVPIDAIPEVSDPENTLEGDRVQREERADYLLQRIRYHANNGRPRWDELDWQIFDLLYAPEVMTLREIAKRLFQNENTVKYRIYNRIDPVLEKVRREPEEE